MITSDDIRALREQYPEIKAIEPQLIGHDRINYLSKELTVQVEGATEAGKNIRGLVLAEGRYINAGDVEDKARVCVLGSTAARKLFGEDSPIGKNIAMCRSYFRVDGVTRSKGDLIKFDYDNKIIIPVTTYQQRAGFSFLNAVLIQAKDGKGARVLKNQVHNTILTKLIRGRDSDDISVWCQDELLDEQNRVLSILKTLVIAVSGISLLVSGTGIMNIMLVSVVERTKEIGIRKAVGARKHDIIIQFLIESILICGIGGVIGIILGIVIANQTTRSSATALSGIIGEWSPIFLPQFFLLAFGCALAVGLVAGILPAYKAANLDPVDALRHE